MIDIAREVNAAMGCFDRVAQHGKGDASMVLYNEKNHFFHLKLGQGSCTNTKSELLALWGLHFVSSSVGLPQVLVFGDSKTIIKWVSNVDKLQVMELDH